MPRSGGNLVDVLKYVGLCFAWGAGKAALMGVHRTPGSHIFSGFGMPELSEELIYRVGLERGLLARSGLSATSARLAQAAVFGLGHPGLEVDAALGGFVYSKAFEKHGLLGALAAHVAHNAGCWFGSK